MHTLLASEQNENGSWQKVRVVHQDLAGEDRDFFSILLYRHDITYIDLHRRGLLNKTNTQYQAVAFFFA